MSSFFKSFSYAAKGFKDAVKSERNFRFHLCAAFYVYMFSLFYSFGATEYLIINILVGGVLALELVNSAIERVADKACSKKSTLIEHAKDMAAGAVLVFSILAAICGVMLFYDTETIKYIVSFFANNLWLFIILLISVIFSWLFVFRLFIKKDKDNL